MTSMFRRLGLACLLLVSFAQFLSAQDQWSGARSALMNLENWLNQHGTGPGWRSFLELDQLRTELNRGSSANRESLFNTLEHLSSGTPGTELSRFANLRQALQSSLTSNRADLPFAMRAARANFKPVTSEQVEAAKSKLYQRIINLEQYLGVGSSNGESWKQYLRWEQMNKVIKQGEKGDPDDLYEITLLYTNGYEGLERPVFANVGHALREYADLLAVKVDANASITHAQRMTALATAAEELAKKPVGTDPAEFAIILGELQAARQVPDLVAAGRRLYSQPNLYLKVHSQLLGAAMNTATNETGSITDNILGTRISGTTHTVANMRVTTHPSQGVAKLDLHLTGNAGSNTVGFNGPAVIYSKGNTRLDAHKYLTFDENGLHEQGLQVWADTKTQFTGFGATSKHFKGIVTRAAAKRAPQSKASAEYVASRHAEDRLRQRIESQSLGQVDQANRELQAKLKAPLQRWGVYPQQINVGSDSQGILINALTADPYQLGATSSPPYQGPESGDVQLRIHESLINNAATTILAGRTLTKQYVEDLAKRSGRPLPAELQAEDEKDWSIKLDGEKPFYVKFEDNGMTLQIRGEEFTSGDDKYDAMNITAKYKFATTDRGTIIALRQGEVEILPPDFKPGGQLTVKQTALKRLLTKRFEKLLKPELSGEGIQLQGRLASYGKLFLRTAMSKDGWLQASLAR